MSAGSEQQSDHPGPIPDRLRDKIRAYPGTTTYLDLIRKNKRQSAWLIVLMILLGAALGSAIAGAAGIYLGAPAPGGPADARAVSAFQTLAPSMVVGGMVALIVASLAAVWSWTSGANAILRMARAVPITKEADPELFNVVDEIRIAAGLPMPRIYMLNDSAMNAFATGRDPDHAVIAITKGLRDRLNRDELQGVIAHEMAHVRHLDIRFAMLMATMVGIIVVVCDAILRITWYSGGIGRRSGRRGQGGSGGGAAIMLVLALVLAILAPFLARMIQMAYSRQREYLADAGAVELTRNPEGLASALRRLAEDTEPLVDTANRGTAHMYIVNPLRKMRKSKNSLNTVFSSHPPIEDRIARLLALVR